MPVANRIAAAAAAVLLFGAAPAPKAASANAAALLREAAAAYGKCSFVGQVQNTDFGQSRAESVLFRVEHRAPSTTRRWYLAPEAMYGDSIVSLGDTSYEVDTHHNQVVVMEDDAIDDQVAEDENFTLLLHNYAPVMAPDDNIAGRRTLSVMLVNKHTGQTVMRIGVDVQTKLVLEKERYSPSGAVSHQMRFEQIRYTSDLPAQLFTVPANLKRIEGPSHGISTSDLPALVRTAGFRAAGPKYLPEGFSPIAGDVSEIKGVRTLHLMYSDGLRTVSLFQNARGSAIDLSGYKVNTVELPNRTAQYVVDGATTLMSWTAGNLHFALVGELSREEMVRIASSVSS